ncbi:GCN5 family acetyltransferase [Paenibacillus elgii]|uniref:GCN5 family acetyltransferase n=1 Tax=Paenibacillus elgii TaxID=189691 RepID=A0A163UHA0_9BACL|nr:GNAT family N-acetyltransferase [Paenibacillus elgii]KZE73327.1 GCN5 family acetyltransferase [Paenibacillus elgii]
MNIRLASVRDIEGIARVHVESWKSTYNGIISESFLSNLTVEKRTKNWKVIFDNLTEDGVIYVVEDLGSIRGFVHGGKSREPDFEYDAELYAIYLLKEVQGNGYGKLLFERFIEALKQRNYRSFMLWVLEDNPSVEFYKKQGGQYLGKKEIQIGEDKLTEIALGWKGI